MATRRPEIRHPLYGTVVEEWWCPVCNGAAHRTYRAGRPRVYCSNACRQRAYRWRRDNHARLAATVEYPAERASYGLKGHALRSKRDFVSNHSDSLKREITVCGVFARPSRNTYRTHSNFVLDNTSWSCASCVRLVAIPNDTIDSSWPPVPLPWYGKHNKFTRRE